MSDAFKLIEVHELDLDWFMDQIQDDFQKRTILDQLRLSNVLAICQHVGTKEGNRIYRKWRTEQLNKLNRIDEEKNQTVFERLRNRKGKTKSNTIFDKLIYLREKK